MESPAVHLPGASVFLDFDGTVSTSDIGVTLLEAFGRPGWQCLTDAIGNPSRDAAAARQAAEAKRRQAEFRAQQQRAEHGSPTPAGSTSGR